MKILFFSLAMILNADAFAQFTVAPFGSSQSGAPPVGQNRKGACGGSDCSFELNIKPYCFGTNLRAYGYDRQMDPKQNITMSFSMSDVKNPANSDAIQVVFPARMTYASAGVRSDCSFDQDQSMNPPGYKDMTCFVPWKNKEVKYKLSGWLQSTNPQDNPYLGAEFNKYGGVPLYATIIGAEEGVDSNITCLYKFNQNNKHGTLLHDSVSCYYPSQLPDLSSLIKVYKGGVELNNVEVQANTNNIKIRFKEAMKAIVSKNPVRHGKIVLSAPPRHSISYQQPGGSGMRTIAAQRELESFDEASAYQTFTTQVKFPGMEGFCGGYYSPLMLFFDHELPQFTGVSLFPLHGIEPGTRINWPEANSAGHFLAHLKKGEKQVTSYHQIFGKTDKHENGFDALKVHDKNGDNVIDSKDAVFKELVLWNDANGDGVSQDSELKTLKSMGVKAISVKYDTRSVTNFGDRARAREKSKFTFVKDGQEIEGDIFDVWLSPLE